MIKSIVKQIDYEKVTFRAFIATSNHSFIELTPNQLNRKQLIKLIDDITPYNHSMQWNFEFLHSIFPQQNDIIKWTFVLIGCQSCHKTNDHSLVTTIAQHKPITFIVVARDLIKQHKIVAINSREVITWSQRYNRTSMLLSVKSECQSIIDQFDGLTLNGITFGMKHIELIGQRIDQNEPMCLMCDCLVSNDMITHQFDCQKCHQFGHEIKYENQDQDERQDEDGDEIDCELNQCNDYYD